jgi:hypothetical protein
METIRTPEPFERTPVSACGFLCLYPDDHYKFTAADLAPYFTACRPGIQCGFVLSILDITSEKMP